MQISTSIVSYFNKIKLGFIYFFLKNKIIILLLVCALFYISLYFLIDFSTQSLVAHDEGLYSRRARLLEGSDNWFSPPFQSPHHKTLGSYWFISLSIRLFGTSELALRLPSILSSFLCLISTYLIALKITNKKSALLSVFSLSSMPLWIQYSRYASPDIPFVLCILLVILFFLQSLDSSEYITEYFYIFLSGLFISTSFFIRSYMSFVPLIGLTPFIYYHLFTKETILKIFFFTGIFIGSIPTCLNLYFSFHKFGLSGITALFDFAKKQAVGEFGFNNILFAPLKFIYLTFPIGILLLLLVIFTSGNIKNKYPLLTYFYPLLSLCLLLFMSTSYPHYYLFLLPSLSIISSSYLFSNSFRYTLSKSIISSLLLIVILLVSSFILFFIISYNELLIQYSYDNTTIVYFVLALLLFSYFTSIRFLFDIKSYRFNLINFFYNLVIPQYISLSLLFNFGIIGNPNYKTKTFLQDETVSSIINSNTIYLYRVDSKTLTLLSYYLPSYKLIYEFDDIANYKYVITSNINFLDKFDVKNYFASVKKFDNHLLLMNITK